MSLVAAAHHRDGLLLHFGAAPTSRWLHLVLLAAGAAPGVQAAVSADWHAWVYTAHAQSHAGRARLSRPGCCSKHTSKQRHVSECPGGEVAAPLDRCQQRQQVQAQAQGARICTADCNQSRSSCNVLLCTCVTAANSPHCPTSSHNGHPQPLNPQLTQSSWPR
jgi:hypothetical protein